MGASGPQTQPLSNSGTVLLDTQWAYAHYGRSLSEAVEYYGCCLQIYIQHGVATGFSPTREGTAEMQGFGTCRSQSAQIYVDYEQDAPVARCRERRAVSPMAASASVDKALAGWRTRRRHTNRCNADRVSLVGGRR